MRYINQATLITITPVNKYYEENQVECTWNFI